MSKVTKITITYEEGDDLVFETKFPVHIMERFGLNVSEQPYNILPKMKHNGNNALVIICSPVNDEIVSNLDFNLNTNIL